MSRIYKIIWTLAIISFVVSIIAFSFVIILIGLAIAGLLGIYHYYLLKRRAEEFVIKADVYKPKEVIDIYRIDIK